MTDANQQDPEGEKTEEQQEPIRYSASDPIPESPRGRLARESRQDPVGEKTEEQSEPIRYSASDPIPESPRGRLARESRQGNPKGERPEEKPQEPPEPPAYSVIEPPPEIPENKPAKASQQKNPKGEQTEEKPEPLGYSLIESPPESPKDKPAKASRQKNPNAEKPEEKPEPLLYSIVEPAPESAEGIAAKAGQQSLDDEKRAGQPEPPGYLIVEPPSPPPSDRFLNAGPGQPAGTSAEAKAKSPAPAPALGQPPAKVKLIEGVEKAAKSSTKIYIWAGVGFGVLFGCAIAVLSWHFGAPDVPHDWGSATSDAAGLKGHLFTSWDNKLEYRLVLEPGDPGRRAEFALAVIHPPRPLSVEIQLRDTQGFALCSREVILKYDAGSAPAPAASNPGAQAATAGTANAAGGETAQALQKLAAAQEAERELGKEVFQNEIGSDGQLAVLRAQGEFPCSEKDFGSAFSWSFSTNFPSLAEQEELAKRLGGAQASGVSPTAETPAARRKAARVPAPKLLPFTIEGDDAIVDFDISRGVIETRSEKTFLFDKTSGEIGNPKWQEFPVSIHYICDQASRCMITHSGAGGLRVKMSR
jgi:hypothetical protein